jgi:2'-5' RNA ligase
VLRLFLAVDLPDPVRREIVALCTQVNQARWVKPHQLHMTLRFMGQTPDDGLAEIRNRLANVQVPAFDLALQSAGVFPGVASTKRARVLWLGLEPMEPLVRLKHAIDACLGPDAERGNQGFSPHLTLARFTGRTDATLTQFLSRYQAYHGERFRVACFKLYQSTLHSRGAVHEVMATYPLAEISPDDQTQDTNPEADPSMISSQTIPHTPLTIEGPLAPSPRRLMQPNLGFTLDADLYHGILDQIEDGVYFVDREKRILLWNRGAEKITGFRSDQMVGEHCDNQSLCHIDASGRLLCTNGCPLQRAVDTGVPIEADAFLQHKLGHRVPVKIRTIPLRDRNNSLVGAVEVFRSTIDNRRQDQLIEELSHLAMIDELTMLPNRRHFDMQLDRRLAELGRFGWPFGVLMIDIDQFKQVNDSAGHLAGDEILRLVARTLSSNCRGVDTIARWGGEEFTAIITNVREDGLRLVAEKLRAMVEASGLRESESAPLQVTISIGGAVARADESAGELMKRADQMMYAAKRSGRNRVCI